MMLRSSARGVRVVANSASSEAVPSCVALARTLTTAAASAPADVVTQRSSALFDYRRLKDKQGWRKVVSDEDVDFVVFPRERLGRNYNLNWAICAYAVVPNKNGEQFHNLHPRGLQMLSTATADKDKALHVNVPEEDFTFNHHFVLPTPTPPVEGQPAPVELMSVPEQATVISDDVFRRISKEVRRFLSEGRYLFLQDGMLGSHPGSEKVRFFVSNASTALHLTHVVPKHPRTSVSEFEENITVFVAPELKNGNLGVPSDRFTVMNFKTNQVFVVGTSAPEAIQQAVATMATYLQGKKGALPLQCDSTLTKEGKPVLIFDSGLLQKKPRGDVFGANSHFWTNDGISRLYDGVTVANPDASLTLNRGDLVFHATKGSKTTRKSLSTPLQVQGHLAPHPSALVFVSPNAKTGLTKISAEEAAKSYLASFKFPVAIQPDLLKQRFSYLLSNKNVTAYQVGTTKGQLNVDAINTQLNTTLH